MITSVPHVKESPVDQTVTCKVQRVELGQKSVQVPRTPILIQNIVPFGDY